MENPEGYNKLVQKLTQFYRKENFILFLSRFTNWVMWMVVGVTVVIFAEMVLNFNTATRTILYYSMLFIPVVMLIVMIALPLLKSITAYKFSLETYAKKIGEVEPLLKDELLNALQMLKDEKATHSKILVNAAFESVYSKADKLNFNKNLSYKKVTEKAGYAASFFVVLFLANTFVTLFGNAFDRISNYNTDFTPPPMYSLSVEPGNIDLTKGETLTITVKLTQGTSEDIKLGVKHHGDVSFNETNLKGNDNTFTYKVNEIKSSLEYFAYIEDVKSPVFRVNVIDRPIITALELDIIPPAYSGLEKQVQHDNGNISTLKGSVAKINLSSSKVLSDAVIKLNKSQTKDLDVSGTKASGSLKLLSNSTYSFLISDTTGLENINPIEYSIKVQDDEYPLVELLQPAKDVKLGAEPIVPLAIKISDDFGFSSLKIAYTLQNSLPDSQTELQEITLPFPQNENESLVEYVWNLAELYLMSGDVVTYYIEVADNDAVSGPKTAKSKSYTITVPSLDEIFEEAENAQENSIKDMQEVMKEAQELKKEMQRISNELKRDEKEITWEEKESIKKALEKYEELAEKTSDVKKQLNEMKQELQKNNMLSKETMDKYQELQKLMEEMAGEELRKALEQMQNQMNNDNRDENQMAFEDIKKNEEYFQKSIERTLNLLKRIQIEQKMDELAKRSEDILEKQQKNMEEMQNSQENSQEQKDQNAKNQDDITENLEKMKEQLEKLKEQMSEFDDMPKEQLEKMMEEFEKQNSEELSEEASRNMQQNQQQQAMQQMQQVAENQQQMQQMMQQMQQQMQQQNQVKTFKEMMRAVQNILALSKKQESLNKETEGLNSSSPQLNDVAKKQSQTRDNLNSIYKQLNELGQKSFAVSPEMGKALGEADLEMQKSLRELQNRNTRGSGQSQREAMKSLNEAAMLMNNAMQQMMQQGGGQGGGMMSLMQQLKKMGQQQMQLNQMTRQLQQQGKMSKGMMQQLQKLAGEQQMIQKSLSELNKEAKASGESKKLSSNLEKILGEMEEVISGMKTEKLNDDLMLKQENILSRLLEAQRSINERDFEKERESNSGDKFVRETPPEILFRTEEGLDKLRDAMLKAAKEGYSQDYENLIRKYFEALKKENATK